MPHSWESSDAHEADQEPRRMNAMMTRWAKNWDMGGTSAALLAAHWSNTTEDSNSTARTALHCLVAASAAAAAQLAIHALEGWPRMRRWATFLTAFSNLLKCTLDVTMMFILGQGITEARASYSHLPTETAIAPVAGICLVVSPQIWRWIDQDNSIHVKPHLILGAAMAASTAALLGSIYATTHRRGCSYPAPLLLSMSTTAILAFAYALPTTTTASPTTIQSSGSRPAWLRRYRGDIINSAIEGAARCAFIVAIIATLAAATSEHSRCVGTSRQDFYALRLATNVDTLRGMVAGEAGSSEPQWKAAISVVTRTVLLLSACCHFVHLQHIVSVLYPAHQSKKKDKGMHEIRVVNALVVVALAVVASSEARTHNQPQRQTHSANLMRVICIAAAMTTTGILLNIAGEYVDRGLNQMRSREQSNTRKGT